MSLRKSPKVFFLTPYPLDIAPGPRFRYEQYLSILKKRYIVKLFSFVNESDYAQLSLAKKNSILLPIILKGFLKRIQHILACISADYVFLFREATPVGPPVIEWVLVKLLRKKLIYDFDDAIWLTDKTDESRFERLIRWRSKVALICKWSYKVSCGNDYLAKYASKFNHNVVVNPTTIDLKKVDRELKKIDLPRNEIVIGWTGSHSTLKYLEQLEGVLSKVENQFPQVRFQVIADRQPNLKLQRLKFIKWNRESEIEDLRDFTIGIMPLPDDEWTQGKCGFKALQYMSLSIPTIASPVGVNSKIIHHNINGMLAMTNQEWMASLSQLIAEPEKRKQLGDAGRKTIEAGYCVDSNEVNFLSLFN